MAHFFRLKDRMDEIAREHFAMAQAASDNMPTEVKAIIRCQSTFRGSKVRKKWRAVLESAHLIQRVTRGWSARQQTRKMKSAREQRLNALFFHHCGAVIQKYFRGWWSRRHLHDYYGRKGYLEKVEKRGAWTVDYLRQQHRAKFAEAKAEEEKHMRQEFDTLAGELHHLVSTKTIAGVYNPPYNDALPRAFDMPIEQHLRDSCRAQAPKSLRKPRHRIALAASHSPSSTRNSRLGKTPTEQHSPDGATFAAPPQDQTYGQPYNSRSASTGRTQKIQGPFKSKQQIEVASARANKTYKSICASTPYHAGEENQKLQDKLTKLTRVSPVPFVAPGMTPERPPPSSVHASVPYRERPVELRHEYVELPKIREKPPFFTSLPRDKTFDDYQEQHLIPNGGHV